VTLTLNRPWSNISTAHCLIILDICAKLFVNPTRRSKDIEGTRNSVIQCLILDCDLDLEPTLVKHRHCTLSHHTWHLCNVICKSHQGFKRYRADRKAWQTDGWTDRRTDGCHTIIRLKFHFGRIKIRKSYHLVAVLYCSSCFVWVSEAVYHRNHLHFTASPEELKNI